MNNAFIVSSKFYEDMTISAGAKWLFLEIASYSASLVGYCQCHAEDFAKKFGYTEAEIQVWLDELVKADRIKVLYEKVDGEYYEYCYTIEDSDFLEDNVEDEQRRRAIEIASSI